MEIMTSYTNASARAKEFDSIMPYAQLYEKVEEFTEFIYRYTVLFFSLLVDLTRNVILIRPRNLPS